jgi:hypothetical protein
MRGGIAEWTMAAVLRTDTPIYTLANFPVKPKSHRARDGHQQNKAATDNRLR